MAKSKPTSEVKKTVKPVQKPAPKPKKSPGRPAAPILEYVTKIEKYLMLGYSLPRACELGGVPYTTVRDHIEKDESIRNKIDLLMNSVSLKARANVVERINNKDYHASVDWLERKEKNEWSKRQELTGENGQPIQQEIIVTIKDTHADKLRDKLATKAARSSGRK